jgi:hypothetical protein
MGGQVEEKVYHQHQEVQIQKDRRHAEVVSRSAVVEGDSELPDDEKGDR